MGAEDDLLTTLTDLMEVAPAGFAVGLHIRFTTPTFMFQTYPKSWVEEYSRDALLTKDPTVAWAFANTGRVGWADLAGSDTDGVFPRAAAHGLRHGLMVSLLRDGSRSLGGFARADRAFTPAEEERLEACLGRLHAATALTRTLPDDLRDALHRLSVAFTHP